MKSKWINGGNAIRVRRCRRRVKEKILNHYGYTCACCGETNTDVLSLNHIKGGGTTHRKEVKVSGQSFNLWVIRNNFPKDLQVMCLNCNSGSWANNGICPHVDAKVF
jgi:hypothetical protein